MSAVGLPVHATSLPSKFDVYWPCMALPCASVPSDVSLIPAGVDSNFSVWARATASELNFDFAAFSFHEPTQLFEPAKAAGLPRSVATPSSMDETNRFFRIRFITSVFSGVWIARLRVPITDSTRTQRRGPIDCLVAIHRAGPMPELWGGAATASSRRGPGLAPRQAEREGRPPVQLGLHPAP